MATSRVSFRIPVGKGVFATNKRQKHKSIIEAEFEHLVVHAILHVGMSLPAKPIPESEVDSNGDPDSQLEVKGPRRQAEMVPGMQFD